MKQESSSPWKLRLVAFGLGLGVLAIIYLQAVFISNDARIMYATGVVLLFAGAIWLGRKDNSNWLDLILLCLPVFGVFYYSVLDTMLLLWPHLLLWAIAVAIGFTIPKISGRSVTLIGVVIVFVVSSFWYCGWYMPNRLARQSNHFGNSSAPGFTLQSVGDRSAVLAPKAGKILVMDFFSTTCVPCIAELPELSAAHNELSNDQDVDFVLIASDIGRDTPEGFLAFAKKRHITIPLAFDRGGKVYDSFGLHGIPAIVVIDREGHVRLTRKGYNAAEAGFRRDLVQFLRTL